MNDEIQWTEEEQRLLRASSLVAELRRHHERGGGESSKPLWLQFFQTASATALITVVIGGIFGTIITSRYQSALEEKELAVQEEKQVMTARLDTVTRAFDLLSTILTAADHIIVATGPEFDSALLAEPERERVADQVDEVVRVYNTADSKWNTQSRTLGMLLGYYHRANPTVGAQWHELVAAVDTYSDCARSWYVQRTGATDHREACGSERSAVDTAIDDFTESFTTSQTPRSRS